MKIETPKMYDLYNLGVANAKVIQFKSKGKVCNLLVSYSTALAVSVAGKLYRIKADHPMAYSMSSRAHYKAFVRWLGYDDTLKENQRDALPEVEVI